VVFDIPLRIAFLLELVVERLLITRKGCSRLADNELIYYILKHIEAYLKEIILTVE
jgi:hypothetical protein